MREQLKMRRRRGLCGLRLCTGIFLLCLLFLGTVPAQGADFSGRATTILRAGSYDDKNYYPAYEYLSLALTDLWDGRISVYAGGWGRYDLADKSTDEYYAGDLQYGYITFSAPQNNFFIGLGRQYITDGGVSELMDGLYVRSDLPVGFGAGAFVGVPVAEEPDEEGGDFIFGGRLSQSVSRYYTIGVSYLDVRQDGEFYRQEETVDLWIHPFAWIDLVGLSSYNSITEGWMEHDYILTYAPLDELSFDVNFSQINYEDYFFHMTTDIFDLISLSNPTGYIDPDEEMMNIGGSIFYSPFDWVTLGVEYRKYSYEVAGDADNYGARVAFSTEDDFAIGASAHRMDGDAKDLRYLAYRLYVSKQMDDFRMTVDFFNVAFDSSINGIKNSYIIAAGASYAITPELEIGGSVDYSESPEFNSEVTGLLKLTYMFDFPIGEPGRVK